MSDTHSPNVVRHLELIQDVIRRMAGNSFAVRRWSVATTAALVGAAIVTEEAMIAFTAAVPAILYWHLDAYYLHQERWFRALYDKVRTEPNDVEPFSMATLWSPEKGGSLWATFWSLTEWLSHAPLLIVAIVTGLALY